MARMMRAASVLAVSSSLEFKYTRIPVNEMLLRAAAETPNVASVLTVFTEQDKIISIDEYWADDGDTPQWHQKMHIGKPIK